MKYKTKSSYKACYLLQHGGTITSIKTILQTKKKREKKGYGYQWIFEFDNVPENVVMALDTAQASMKVHDIEGYRKKLKKYIRKSYEN